MEKNNAWAWWVTFAVVVVLVLGWVFVNRAQPGDGPAVTPVTIADPTSLPGLLTTLAPWSANQTDLKARLALDGMAPQTMEGEVMHIHQHLDIFVGGKPVAVPANIGVKIGEQWLSSIHIHDATGIIHVESPFVADYTLGQFFDIWGVKFTASCLGGYCADSTHSLKVYVNGELYTSDPRLLVLASHQEIVVVYGTESEVPATIPSAYEFKAGS